MAIVTFRNYKRGQNRACMAAVMKYAQRGDKVECDDVRLVTGINCRPETVCEDIMRTKQIYHKEGGTMFYYMVQSFPKGADVDPKTAHAAAVELAGYFKDHEVLVCTHTDREHVHSHFIINSVNFETGKKLHMADEQIQELRQRNDMVCERFHLPVFEPAREKKQEKKIKPMTIGEYHVAAKGQSWKFRLMATVDECMGYAKSREEFIALMQSEGYDVRWTDTRKYITYTTSDGNRCRDNKLHEEKYLKENMENEFKIRQGILDAEVFDGRAEGSERQGYQGYGGHPVLISQKVLPSILRYRGGDGLRGAIRASGAWRAWVDVDDKGVILNVHNSEDLQKQLKAHNAAILHPVLHMRMEMEAPFLNERLKLLLFLISNNYSIRSGCACTGLAYSKAWEMINQLEQNLGYQIVERQRGGTSLTPEGERFLLAYQEFEETIHQIAQKEFHERFISTKIIR